MLLKTPEGGPNTVVKTNTEQELDMAVNSQYPIHQNVPGLAPIYWTGLGYLQEIPQQNLIFRNLECFEVFLQLQWVIL